MKRRKRGVTRNFGRRMRFKLDLRFLRPLIELSSFYFEILKQIRLYFLLSNKIFHTRRRVVIRKIYANL